MNFMKSLVRAASTARPSVIRPTLLAPRLFSTAPSVTVTQQPTPPPPQLDKLYKRVELEMRGVDQAVLLSYSWFCVAAASHLGIDVTKSWALRKAEKERHTLLKSVHIYKKHRVQYEIRTYFRFVHLQRMTGSTCDTYLEYIERNLPEGCALKVTKIECTPVPEHITPPEDEK